MEMKRIIKLRTNQGLAKRIDFPNNYEELIDKAKTFLPLEDSSKKYQFIEEKANREIHNQEDFELMSKEYKSEKTTKILVNIVEKDSDDQLLEDIPISHIKLSENKINLNIATPTGDTKENKEEESEESNDKIKNDIKELVRNKMKDLENNIIQDIYQSIKTQLTANEENFKRNQIKNQNDFIHNGIKCNNCNMENIKGIRYKCLHCPSYNLCSDCEKNNEHDISHIFIKIRKPLKEEDELLMQIKRELKYKNNEYKYSVDKTDIKFKIANKENNILVQQINVENNGNIDWAAGCCFKCLPDSQIIGNDMKIENKVNKGESTKLEIIFENFEDSLKPSVNEYYIYYQMFNDKNEAFGNITKFRLLFED